MISRLVIGFNELQARFPLNFLALLKTLKASLSYE